MKKSNLFLVLMMALIVMSCSKDETTMSTPQEGNAIEFGTYVGRDAQTRATMINDLTALKGTGFGVFAYYTDNSDYEKGTSKPNFMYNQLVSGTVASGTGTVGDPYVYTWSYSPVKYWPNEDASNTHGETGHNNDKVSFFAYAPYSAASTTDALNNFVFAPDNATAGDPKITYTVNALAKSQEDLLWGVNSTNGFPFKDQQKQTIGGNINFQFKHALARIGFNVQAMIDQVTGNSEDIAANTDIVVTKVELIGNFYGSGTLNLNNAVAYEPSWVDVAAEPEERTFELKAGTSDNTNFKTTDTKGESHNETFGQPVAITQAQLNADDSYLMVIPQTFAADNKIKIRVTYDVITADDKLDTKQSKVTNVITSEPFAFTFAAGIAYSFNLHLGLTSVKFSATVEGWDETTPGTVVNVPINTGTNP